MTPPLHDSIVRFWRPGGARQSVAGTGFLARGADGNAYVLTCAHVANLVFGRRIGETAPLIGCTTTAELSRRGEVTLDLLAWFPPPPITQALTSPVADIAIFAPRNRFAEPFIPPLRVEPPERVVPPRARVEFHSFGFQGIEDGTPTSGVLTAANFGPWFVAQADARSPLRFIEEGLSGAPVFANNSVLGMITQRLEREVKQGLAIPAFALARAWPPLAQPYPGLPAFDAPTAHLYFGRGRPLKQLVDRLELQRLVGLMGASGSGKSSLARAAVVPLYERRGWASVVFRPGLNPLQNLAEAIAVGLGHAQPGEERIAATEKWVSRLEAANLAAALNAARDQDLPGTLIVVDQFEEFFTADPACEAGIARQRTILLPQLLAAALDRTDSHVLLTGRRDLMERMVTGDAVAARMLGGPLAPYVLTVMEFDEVVEAVSGPANVFGATVDPFFAKQLATETTRTEGRLPLLQAALVQAWSELRRVPGQGWHMAGPDLPAGTGLLDGAIRTQADLAVAELRRGRSDRDPIKDHDLYRVLLSLVRLDSGSATRRLLLRTDTSPGDWTVLEALAGHRLVTLSGEQGTAELVHESVMTAWPLFTDLIKEHADFLFWRTHIDREFQTWNIRGRKEDDLLRRQDVALALEWLESNRPDRPRPTRAEAEFIAASRDHHDRRTRELERLLAQARAAEAAANEARNAALLQESRALAAFAQQESARGDHMTAVLLALEALPRPAYGGDRPLSSEAAAALRNAWMRNRESCLAGHTAWVSAASFSPDGRRVVTASWDHTARVWDLSGPRPTATVLEGHTDRVLSAAFSPDGRRVVTASDDRTAQVWDLSGPRPTATVLKGHTDMVLSAAFSPDGRRVVTASSDRTARVWDLSGRRPTATVLEGHTDRVLSAAFSPDGRRLVTASSDDTARVWDLSGPRPTATVLEGHTNDVKVAAFSPDGRRVVTASADHTARVWDLSGPRPTATVLEGPTHWVGWAAFSPDGSAAFSPDGRRVVTASGDGAARVWDLFGWRPTATVLAGHTNEVNVAAFSPDGRRVVTSSDDKTARVWDLFGPRPTATVLEGHTHDVNVAAFSPDGRRVVTASGDKTARVWDLSGPRPTATVLKGHTDMVLSAAFSPDGRRVVTSSDDKTARVWDLSGPRPIATALEGHTASLLSAAFSPDGRRVVTASGDGTARVWDLSGPRPTATVLEGHTDTVLSAAFSPDGRRVVTASGDGTARVWDLSGPRPTATVLEGHTDTVWSAAFSPDGRRVVTSSDDKTARVWETYPDVSELSALVVAHLSRCLSTAQREHFGLAVEGTTRPRDFIPPPDAEGRCPR